MKRLAALDWKELARAYQAGATATKIAQAVGCSISNVLIHLRKVGAVIRIRGPAPGTPMCGKLSLEVRAQLVARIQECRGTLSEIGREFGVTRERVRQLAEANGVKYYRHPERTNRKLQHPKWDLAVARYQNGETIAEIIPSLGCCPLTLSRILKRKGVKLRRGRQRPKVQP